MLRSFSARYILPVHRSRVFVQPFHKSKPALATFHSHRLISPLRVMPLTALQQEALTMPPYKDYRSLVPPLSEDLHKGQGGKPFFLPDSILKLFLHFKPGKGSNIDCLYFVFRAHWHPGRF